MESAVGTGAAAGPWDDFLVGPANALAHAGTLALARGERAGISPLVVHGPAGVGKSRLLSGLVAEVLVRQPGAAVALVAAEEFAATCAEAAGRAGGWSELRERFRHLDLFVLDDLQTLAPAPLALAELAYTLDSLEATGAAVAVSARTGPGQWSDLPTRLVSRLGGGLTARIEPPDRDARRQYLLARARARGLTIAADALERLAETTDGYRTLDGFLNRLALESKVNRHPIDLGLVTGALDEPGAEAPTPTIDQIARAVAARFGVRAKDLRAASRHRGLVAPRHLAMYLARIRTGASFAAIGAYFGHRDPATVRHACRMAQQRLATDPGLAALVPEASPGSRT